VTGGFEEATTKGTGNESILLVGMSVREVGRALVEAMVIDKESTLLAMVDEMNLEGN